MRRKLDRQGASLRARHNPNSEVESPAGGSAGFQTCYIAGFQVGWSCKTPGVQNISPPAGLETGDTAQRGWRRNQRSAGLRPAAALAATRLLDHPKRASSEFGFKKPENSAKGFL
jgi:hypothetical protein